jgi:hypothetical protein
VKPGRPRDDCGAIAVLVLVLVLVACVVAAGVLRAGVRAAERARAEAVADAAALAGADQLALGADSRTACAAAASTASAGSGRVRECRADTHGVEVVVAIVERAGIGRELRAVARADVDR